MAVPRQGRDLFARHCAGCHKASDLVTTVYGEDLAPGANLCSFLETHGLTDAAKDCDTVAYMNALAKAGD
jgi:mono/diheme cytochrome c family protein